MSATNGPEAVREKLSEWAEISGVVLEKNLEPFTDQGGPRYLVRVAEDWEGESLWRAQFAMPPAEVEGEGNTERARYYWMAMMLNLHANMAGRVGPQGGAAPKAQ